MAAVASKRWTKLVRKDTVSGIPAPLPYPDFRSCCPGTRSLASTDEAPLPRSVLRM